MTKKFILNADGFGASKAVNNAVLEAYEGNFLKSVSLTPNGDFFDDAVGKILPQCPELGVGIHLNITEGKSLCTDIDRLTDANSRFNNNYFKLLCKAYNPKDNEFLAQVEREFRRQIEKVLSKTKVTHIDSKGYIHSILPIFNIVCRLAEEYKIHYVITHFENMYVVPDVYRHFNRRFFKNFLRKLFFNMCTVFNESTVQKYKLKTNDYIIGLSYEGAMDAMAIFYGVKSIKYTDKTIEVVVHPCRYEDGTIDNHFDEYMITKNKKLEDKILRSGYDITNYSVKETTEN